MSSTTEPVPADAGDRPDSLGARLRQARLDAKLSLRELSRQLGVSASFVSQIENGKSHPSVATLYSLTQLLGVSMDRLFEAQDGASTPVGEAASGPEVESPSGPDTEGSAAVGGAGQISRGDLGSPSAAWGDRPESSTRLSVTTPGNRTRLVMDCGVTWDQLARKSDHLDFMEIVYPPGSSSTTDGRMLRHDDYEYGYLLEGELQVTLGFDVFMLRAGEAIGLDSSVPHLFRNLGTTPARGIWVVHHRHD
jgi:DNA-binding XRE family transcriptional regulator/mannose-6-phosphate isomerase-like protein (cupin superfamily)